MIQPQTMFLRSRRLLWVEGPILSIRQFSISRKCLSDSSNASGRDVRPNRFSSSPRAPTKRASIPPADLNLKGTNSDRPRPRRIIDARSLGARQNNGQPTNIVKSSGLHGARNSSLTRTRKPKALSRPTTKKARKGGRSRAPKHSDMEEGDDTHKSEIDNVFHDLAEKAVPFPSRYRPRVPEIHNLIDTWPSLPSDTTAYSASILEKLSLLSDRTPNGYIPPTELGKRLFEGKYVRFFNEKEMSEALAIANNLSSERADKISRQKGDLVEPKPINFKQIDAEHQKALLETLVQGKYPIPEMNQAAQPSVLSTVLRNLRNNETYQAAGKSSRFIGKVESLLTSSRPVKRA